jgi:hypothetical protein
MRSCKPSSSSPGWTPSALDSLRMLSSDTLRSPRSTSPTLADGVVDPAPRPWDAPGATGGWWFPKLD